MSKDRITIDHVAGGQPRPYADTYHLTQVLFELDKGMGAGFEPWDLIEERVRERLKAMHQWCGFTDFRYPEDCADPKKPTPSEYFTTRLDYLRKIGPGLWEFRTTNAYTD